MLGIFCHRFFSNAGADRYFGAGRADGAGGGVFGDAVCRAFRHGGQIATVVVTGVGGGLGLACFEKAGAAALAV